VRRLSLRLRLTLAFSVVMALLLGLTGLVVYRTVRSDLNNSIDRSLKSRAAQLAAAPVPRGDGDDFSQVLTRDGRVVASSPQVQGHVLLAGDALRRAAKGPVLVDHPAVPALEGSLRLRAVPAHGGLIAVAGTALGERNDSLRTLALALAGGGAFALLLASLAGYAVATGALRPVEAMRRRAAAISAGEPGSRLPVPDSSDEIARLGETLNEMLGRLEAAFERERAFTADASHELRTPLTILKAELELALREGRSPEELRGAIESAAEETDRLIRLAEDLLAIARLEDGRLPLRPERLDASELAAATAERFEARAAESGRSVRAPARASIVVEGDRERLEQALGNLVDNALRHGEGDVVVEAVERDRLVKLHVRDSGPGFPPAFIDQAFERFTRGDAGRARGGAGLGLAIVAAVAESHGGVARAANLPGGGADVWIELSPSGTRPAAPPRSRPSRPAPPPARSRAGST
jgi:two-component system, OmpR family, sensor kinase